MNATDDTPTWSAVRRTIAEDAQVMIDDMDEDPEDAVTAVVTDSGFVAEENESKMIQEVLEELDT